MISGLAERLGFAIEWFMPEEGGGAGQTYERDFNLVSAADEVLAYFSPEGPMEGGTGHVVEAAIAREIPVRAFMVDEKGRVERIGELD